VNAWWRLSGEQVEGEWHHQQSDLCKADVTVRRWTYFCSGFSRLRCAVFCSSPTSHNRQQLINFRFAARYWLRALWWSCRCAVLCNTQWSLTVCDCLPFHRCDRFIYLSISPLNLYMSASALKIFSATFRFFFISHDYLKLRLRVSLRSFAIRNVNLFALFCSSGIWEIFRIMKYDPTNDDESDTQFWILFTITE